MAIRARRRSADILQQGESPRVRGDYESHMGELSGVEDPERIVVDLEEGQMGGGDSQLVVDLEDNEVAPQALQQGAFSPPADEKYDHYENLALVLSDSDLKSIGQKVVEAADDDLLSRKEWEDMLAAGTRMLVSGEVEDTSKLAAPMQVLKNVKHPIFAIAVYQFQTRAYKQLMPPTGPAKVSITGKRTEELMQKAERVETFQNYQLTKEDPAFAEQTDQLLLVEAIDGSTFRKWYRDHLKKRNVGRWVRGVDLIVPYSAESLESAIRITHRYKESTADVHRKMLEPESGYRQVQLGTPPAAGEGSAGQAEQSQIKLATDQVQGISPTGNLLSDENQEYTFYEQQVYMDLSEHVDGAGNPTGVPLPYVVVVETETQEVLAIWRDWDEADDRQLRVQHFAHYKFLPGPGFYGLGYSHILVGIAAGTTAAMRILLVGALFASASGGFVTKDAGGRIPSSISIEPGLFKAIDLTMDELKKAFFSPDFKEPSSALPQGIEILLKAAERLSSTVEAMVGDAPTTGPVGTTLALIEQSGELYSGIHQRNHRAMADELRMQFRLNGIYVPEEGYPYVHGERDMVVFKQDFSQQLDIQPVSDPNIFSSTQRIALAQAPVELAIQHPDVLNKRVAIRRLLVAMRVPDPEELENKPPQAVTSDPITENAMALMGMPIKAELEQDHDGHNIVHAQIIQDPNVPDLAKAAMAAHVAEHMAKKVIATAMAAGLPVQDPQKREDGGPPVQPIPPQLARAITQRAVQMIQQGKAAQQQRSPEEMQVASEHALKLKKVEGDLKIAARFSAGKLKIMAAEKAAMARLRQAEQQHKQKIGVAAEGFRQKMDAHSALTKGGKASGKAVAESEAGVNEAQAQLTRAVSDLIDAIAGLSAQLESDTQRIIEEINQEGEGEPDSDEDQTGIRPPGGAAPGAGGNGQGV